MRRLRLEAKGLLFQMRLFTKGPYQARAHFVPTP
jgi:hypothetical protein